MGREISIILPAYNEKDNIAILIPQIEEEFKGQDIEILVIDDSSPDGTADEAERINKTYGNIRVIQRANKEGIGAALREGYTKATGKYILSSDSDLSFDAKDLPRLVDRLRNGADMVVANRHSQKNAYHAEHLSVKIKHFVSKNGNKVIALLTGIRIRDYTANFRGMKQEVWQNIHTVDNTNSLLLEMILKANHAGYQVEEIPVVFKERRFGESKLRLGREVPKFLYKLIYYKIKLKKRK